MVLNNRSVFSEGWAIDRGTIAPHFLKGCDFLADASHVVMYVSKYKMFCCCK